MTGDFGLPPVFEVTEESVDQRTHVLAVRGELDLGTASALAAPLVGAIEAGKTRILIDLTEVSFVGSNGLATLLNGLRRLTRRRGRLAIVAQNPTVLRMFEITRTDSTFAIRPTREEALAYLVDDDAA